MKGRLSNYKDALVYLIFGTIASLLNLLIYRLMYYRVTLANTTSTLIAWAFAFLFGFITNKEIVFSSKASGKKAFRQLAEFLLCRLLTALFDVLFMYVAVDLLDLNPMALKFISNLIAGTINYLIGKFIIFTHTS